MGRVGAEIGAPDFERELHRGANGAAFPRLERVAPDIALPRVEIKWTERELKSLAELASAEQANRPTESLIRAMRD